MYHFLRIQHTVFPCMYRFPPKQQVFEGKRHGVQPQNGIHTRFFFAFSKRTQLWLPKIYRKWKISIGKVGKRSALLAVSVYQN